MDWESKITQYISTRKWEGEDVDEDVIDSWDQALVDEEEILPPSPPISKSKGKSKIQRDEEKKEETVNIKGNEIISTEEIRKLQIEADLHLAKEVFGVEQTTLDTKEDFDKLKEQLVKLLNDANKNSNFTLFSEEVVQFLCTQLPSTDLRKIHNWIGNLQIQRARQERGEKKKTNSKAKTRAKIRLEDENNYDYTSFDCDDFI